MSYQILYDTISFSYNQVDCKQQKPIQTNLNNKWEWLVIIAYSKIQGADLDSFI